MDTSQLEGVSNDIATHSQQKSDAITSEIPTTQNIYTDLANELAASSQQQIQTVQTQSDTDIGKQKQSAAASGFDTTGGYEAGLLRAVQTSYNNQINTLAQQWGMKRQELADTEKKDVQQLTADATQALLDGDTSRASILSSIAQIKQAHQGAVATVASGLTTAANNQASQSLEQQKLAESTRQFNVDQANKKSAAGTGSDATMLSLLAALGLNPDGTKTGTTGSVDLSKYVTGGGSGLTVMPGSPAVGSQVTFGQAPAVNINPNGNNPGLTIMGGGSH